MAATYVIAGGYSAGHLTPGLAVAEALRRQQPDLQVLFAGSPDPDEADFVRAAGVPFLALPGAPWAQRGPWAKTRSLAVIAPAVLRARREFRAVGAVGLMSLGSFAAVAPALAARSLGLPIVIFEPNARFGLANRLIQPFAQRVLTSRLFDRGTIPASLPCAVVGVPLRSALGALTQRVPSPPEGEVRLLVLGGSLGDSFLNERAPALAARLGAAGIALRVTHQCGRGVDPAAVRSAYVRLRIKAVVEPFLDPIAPALGDAHYILTAAGAVTMHEIAAAAVPVLIVPLGEAAAAHQHANAATFARLTGCLQSTEESWDETKVAGEIAAVLRDAGRWRDQSRQLRKFASDDAGGDAVTQILASLRS